MKTNKILFLMMLIMSILMMISSENWISMWMSIEINLMSFIAMMKINNKNSSESMMIYFMVQTISSMIILIVILTKTYMNMENNSLNINSKNMMILTMMMKMGMWPMNMWFISISSKLSWNNCMMMMTLQKMGPMWMISCIQTNKMIMFLAMMNTMFSAISGMNQNNMKKIMSYSSINHTSWMIFSMKMNQTLWIKYMIMYSIMTIMIMKMMKKNKIKFLNQMSNTQKNKTEKMNIMIMMMSISSMPPTMGFLPKWMIIQNSINQNLIMMMMMIMTSIITMMFYLRITIPLMLMNSIKNKWMLKKKKTKSYMIITNLSLPIMMLIMFK